MKSLLLITVLCGCMLAAHGHPGKRRHHKQKDTWDDFDSYADSYDFNNPYPDVEADRYPELEGDKYSDLDADKADTRWAPGVYDKVDVVQRDPNSVWPSDVSDEASGWFSDDEDDSDYYDSDEYFDDEDYSDVVYDYGADIDYVEDEVKVNEDRIYELQDNLDYDEQKIGRMEKKMKKMNKKLKKLQNFVNVMEAVRADPRRTHRAKKLFGE